MKLRHDHLLGNILIASLITIIAIIINFKTFKGKRYDMIIRGMVIISLIYVQQCLVYNTFRLNIAK